VATIHALQRATNRLGVVLDSETINDIVNTADAFAAKCSDNDSVALRLRTFNFMVGEAWSNYSNGDTLIAIIRGRSVVTFMFRRSTQPFAPQYFSTDTQPAVRRCVTL
jgi:hypothetical protein